MKTTTRELGTEQFLEYTQDWATLELRSLRVKKFSSSSIKQKPRLGYVLKIGPIWPQRKSCFRPTLARISKMLQNKKRSCCVSKLTTCQNKHNTHKIQTLNDVTSMMSNIKLKIQTDEKAKKETHNQKKSQPIKTGLVLKV